MYYEYQRWYDPSIGRFISQDPLGGVLSVPQSLNRYAYVGNIPTVLTDPTGAAWKECGDKPCDGGPGSGLWTMQDVQDYVARQGITDTQLINDCEQNPMFCPDYLVRAGYDPLDTAGEGTGATWDTGIGAGSTASSEPSITAYDTKTPTIQVGTSTEVTPASSGGRVAVIGENMEGRVKSFASQYGYETMRDLPNSMPKTEKLSLNREWINSRMDKGYTIIDLGPARGYANYPYITGDYAIEQIELAARNCVRWLPMWGVFD